MATTIHSPPSTPTTGDQTIRYASVVHGTPDEEGDTRPDETRCQHQATHGRGLWQRGLNLVETGNCPGEDVRERQALRESVTLRQFGGAATLSGHALGGVEGGLGPSERRREQCD